MAIKPNAVFGRDNLEASDDPVVDCKACPRLVMYLSSIIPRKAFKGRGGWHRPVPDFGDPEASLLIVGLAPGAMGASRTGVPFMGDKAGVLLYSALSAAGFSSKSDVLDYSPDLRLTGCMITNACHCAPPENKPNRQEFENCRPFLIKRLRMPMLKDVLCVGRAAFEQVSNALGFKEGSFSHGAQFRVKNLNVYCTYHTSGYNQSTKRITKEAVVEILLRIRAGEGVNQ